MKNIVKLGIGVVVCSALALDATSALADEQLDIGALHKTASSVMKGVSAERQERVAIEAYRVASMEPPLWASDSSGARTARFHRVRGARVGWRRDGLG